MKTNEPLPTPESNRKIVRCSIIPDRAKVITLGVCEHPIFDVSANTVFCTKAQLSDLEFHTYKPARKLPETL